MKTQTFSENSDDLMRLDLFLTKSRIIKRRSISQEVAKAGKITKDGREVKPSYNVKEGDILEINYGNKYMKIKVGEDCSYEILEEKKVFSG